jgi:hypothetical protein
MFRSYLLVRILTASHDVILYDVGGWSFLRLGKRGYLQLRYARRNAILKGWRHLLVVPSHLPRRPPETRRDSQMVKCRLWRSSSSKQVQDEQPVGGLGHVN